MIYRFRSRATGDVLMTEEGGEQVLRAMGLAGSLQGAIEPENMPAVIEAIEAAIHQRMTRHAESRAASILRNAPSRRTRRQRCGGGLDRSSTC